MSDFSPRTVVSTVVAALLGLTALSQDVAAQSCAAGFDPPRTVTLPADLRPLIERLLERSPTFQAQWQELVTLPQLRLTVEVHPMIGPYRARSIRAPVPVRPDCCRCRTSAARQTHRAHRARIRARHRAGRRCRPATARATRRSGVVDLGYGYETERAHDAGRRVAREWDHQVPSCSKRLPALTKLY